MMSLDSLLKLLSAKTVLSQIFELSFKENTNFSAREQFMCITIKRVNLRPRENDSSANSKKMKVLIKDK